jgi:hypothetical protein
MTWWSISGSFLETMRYCRYWMLEVKRGPKRLIKVEVEDKVCAVSGFRTVALSSSDLVVPRVHVEVIYAFEAPASPAKLLETGLAKTLVEGIPPQQLIAL